jgi:hypothetical protein
MLSTYKNKFRFYGYSNFTFNCAFGIEEIVDINTTYYVVNFGSSHVVTYNEFWEYQTYKTLDGCALIKAIGDELYVAARDYIYKTDKNVNQIKSFANTGAVYRGLYYNKTCDCLFATSYGHKYIQIFDRNLTLLDSISVGTYGTPYGIDGYKNELFVGTLAADHKILVIQNRTIVKVYDTLYSSTITSIVIDSFGFLAVSFLENLIIGLYHVNGTNMGISKQVLTKPYYFKKDSKGRLIVTTALELAIYY